MEHLTSNTKKYTATQNACKLCSPLGASIVFKGIRGCIPLIHGSQGCATYIRRYLISHYKEPVDIASSNFSEETTIFGGNQNFNRSIENIISQYEPEAIGISTTCLSETIGEDVERMLFEFQTVNQGIELPAMFHASTPSYQGSHVEGFHEAVFSVIKKLANPSKSGTHINLFPDFVSPEDIRHLQSLLADYGISAIVFPDYSDTLDNPSWDQFHRLSPGGTSVEEIRSTGSAKATLELGTIFNRGMLTRRVKQSLATPTAGQYLEKQFDIPLIQLSHPIGMTLTDQFFETLGKISGRKIPENHRKERGRLLDSYIDSHKYIFGKRAVVFGEEDLVIPLVSFLDEIGIQVVLAASGGESDLLESKINEVTPNHIEKPIIGQGWDFDRIENSCLELKPDLMIGHSKGYYIARKLEIPLIRVGFPIHDRMGGQRLLHLGYRGTQQLFDKIVNALIEYKQDKSPVGYKYM